MPSLTTSSAGLLTDAAKQVKRTDRNVSEGPDTERHKVSQRMRGVRKTNAYNKVAQTKSEKEHGKGPYIVKVKLTPGIK